MYKEGKKCVLYVRVSTEMQVDGFSLDGQRNTLKRFAEREGMIIKDIYEDAGKSGKSIEGRPAFTRLLNDIKNGLQIDYIMVYKLSRFGRNAADVLNSLELIQAYDITEELITLMNSVEPSIFIDMLIDKIEYKKYIARLSKHLIRLSRFNTLKESLLSFLNGDNTKYRDFLNMYYLSNEKDTTNEDAVRIMTIHQSKGLEAEAVFVTGCNKESMPGLINDPERIEEERNLFYVACTRAKRYLYISVPLKDMDGKTPLKQSPFVNELLERQMIEAKDEKALYEGLPF